MCVCVCLCVLYNINLLINICAHFVQRSLSIIFHPGQMPSNYHTGQEGRAFIDSLILIFQAGCILLVFCLERSRAYTISYSKCRKRGSVMCLKQPWGSVDTNMRPLVWCYVCQTRRLNICPSEGIGSSFGKMMGIAWINCYARWRVSCFRPYTLQQ